MSARTLSPSASAEGALGLSPATPRLRRSFTGTGLALLMVTAAACGGSTVEVIPNGSGGGGGDATTTSGMGTTTAVSSTAAGVGGSGSSTGTGVVDPCGDPKEDITSIDLGEVNMGSSIEFDVCNRTVGFTALAQAPAVNDVIGVARLKPPSGGSVILNFAMAGHATAVFGRYGWIGAANPMSDSSDSFPVKEGEWAITLGDDDGSIKTAPLTVFARRTMDGQFHGGAVDVNLFVVEGAASQSYLNAVVDEMFPYAGLELGNVTFYPLDNAYATVSSQSEFLQMLQSSEGVGSVPALNLFVIGNFGNAFGDAIGVAGGIPGSPMKHGTGMSGVAYQPSGNATYDASVLRHETGHLAGLFHTTEYSVNETDPLSDTPECASSTMQSNPDSCPDVSNAMFPIAFGATKFSAAQDLVIQGSMLYRGVLQAGGEPVPPKPLPPLPGAPELMPLDPASASLATMAPRSDRPLRASAGALERVLAGFWCTHTGGDYMQLALNVAGQDAPAKLRALALDDDAPEIVRARALKGYARATQGSPLARDASLALASSLAQDRAAPTGVRVAAIEVLASAGGDLAAKAGQRIVNGFDESHLLRTLASELPKNAAVPSLGAPASKTP